jgi:hypothetical protein
MVSLLKLAEITEEGVKFRSPYDDSECMLTPERSIEIQVTNFLISPSAISPTSTTFYHFIKYFYVFHQPSAK